MLSWLSDLIGLVKNLGGGLTGFAWKIEAWVWGVLLSFFVGMVVGGAAVGYLVVRLHGHPAPAAGEAPPEASPPPNTMPQGRVPGWEPRPEEVARALESGVVGHFTDVAPRLVARGAPDADALLYQAEVKATGSLLPAHDQDGVGCCVGEGWSGAVERLECVAIALGRPITYYATCSEAVYGESRVDVGHGRLRGDGSTGAWAAEAVQKYGLLARKKYGSVDLTEFNASRAKSWGDRGVPADLKDEAKKHCVGKAALLKDPEEARLALSNGYPIAVCTALGFSMTRDADGFCHRQGSWGHCMTCSAYRADRRGFLLVQSWGKGTPKGALALGQADNTFWITWADMASILREGDSYAVSDFAGFEPKKLDWVVRGDAAPAVMDLFAFTTRTPRWDPASSEPQFALAP